MSGTPFDAVVFAGGGNRCLWQAGFWASAAGPLGLAPRVVAGVSAGATIACTLLAGVADVALGHFKQATARNDRNIYPLNALRRQPMFPHERMYRGAILAVIDAEAFGRLQAGPELRVLMTRLPRWLGPRSGVLVGMTAYEAEKRLGNPVHPRFARRLGFRPEVASAQSCESPEALADLLLHSSCTPPFTPVFRRQGAPVLDGGLIDNVPVTALEASGGSPPERTLVLLTRRYPAGRWPEAGRRTYVQPSTDLGIGKFDYTRPEGLQRAYDTGLRDGDAFVAAFSRDGGR